MRTIMSMTSALAVLRNAHDLLKQGNAHTAEMILVDALRDEVPDCLNLTFMSAANWIGLGFPLDARRVIEDGLMKYEEP